MSGEMSLFSQRLVTAREQKGLKQSDLAETLGIGFKSVSHWENGRAAPNFSLLCRLADVLDVSIDYLAGRTDKQLVTKSQNTDGFARYGICGNMSCNHEIFNGYPSEDVFCPWCGSKVIYDCPKCGAPVKMKSQRHCMKCGQELQI